MSSFDRSFRSLRLSLTEDCNMACVYCVAEGAERFVRSSVSVETLLDRVKRLHQRLQLAEVRLTGGEPLLFGALPELVAGLQEMQIPRLSLTSNGLLLTDKKAAELKSAGLSDINLSLDAASTTTFARIGSINGAGLDRVRRAIDAALYAGIPTKLNCTVLRSYNDHEIVDLLDFTLERGLSIRFLELMKMGPSIETHDRWFVPVAEMIERIEQRYDVTALDRGQSATARYYEVRSKVGNDRKGRFGTIANHSEPFCSDCDRLRLSADGNLFGCLSHPIGTPMPADDTELQSVLVRLLETKKSVFTGSALSMKYIGG